MSVQPMRLAPRGRERGAQAAATRRWVRRAAAGEAGWEGIGRAAVRGVAASSTLSAVRRITLWAPVSIISATVPSAAPSRLTTFRPIRSIQ